MDKAHNTTTGPAAGYCRPLCSIVETDACCDYLTSASSNGSLESYNDLTDYNWE